MYLHVLNLSEVGILGGEQEGPRLVQLGFHPERLIVQQGELGLQTFVLQSLLHNLFWNIPQIHLKNQEMAVKQSPEKMICLLKKKQVLSVNHATGDENTHVCARTHTHTLELGTFSTYSERYVIAERSTAPPFMVKKMSSCGVFTAEDIKISRFMM